MIVRLAEGQEPDDVVEAISEAVCGGDPDGDDGRMEHMAGCVGTIGECRRWLHLDEPPDLSTVQLFRAAEVLADAAEDTLHDDGDRRAALEAAWQAYVAAAGCCTDPRLVDSQRRYWAERDGAGG